MIKWSCSSTRDLRVRKHQRSGVALLVAITTIAILTVIVTEVTYISRMRLITASNQRDRVQAYWLAKSGTGLYQLILTANKQIGKNEFIQQFGLGNSLWQMIPAINTGMMRMLMVSENSSTDVKKEDVEQFKEQGTVSDKIMEESRSSGVFNDKNFLDFAGDFNAEVTDMESKIDINQLGSDGDTLQDSPTAQRLLSLMSGADNNQWFLDRNLDRWELIGNLKDWVDADTYRSGGLGGQEDALYADEDPPYLSKNAKFDTTDEIRLVEGWNGEMYDKFRDRLTIWSKGKFNLNSFDEEMHKALIRSAALSQPSDASLDMCFAGSGGSVLSVWDIATFNNGKDYATFVLNNCGIELDSNKIQNVTSVSQVFEVTSTGMVGTSTVQITTILDYSSSSVGVVKYIRIE